MCRICVPCWSISNGSLYTHFEIWRIYIIRPISFDPHVMTCHFRAERVKRQYRTSPLIFQIEEILGLLRSLQRRRQWVLTVGVLWQWLSRVLSFNFLSFSVNYALRNDADLASTVFSRLSVCHMAIYEYETKRDLDIAPTEFTTLLKTASF